MKSKVAVVLVIFFMIITLPPLQTRASDNIYGVIDIKGNNQCFLITKDKTLQFNYTGTQDLSNFQGTMVSLSPVAEDDTSVQTDEVNAVTGYNKSSQSSELEYVQLLYKDNAYYYVSSGNDVELRSDIDLQQYVNTYCHINLIKYTYTYGNIAINIPWNQVSSIEPGNPLKTVYKQVTLKGRVQISGGKGYIASGNKLYGLYFDNQGEASKYNLYNRRFVSVTGNEKYIFDLRNNTQTDTFQVYSPKYTLISMLVKYQNVSVRGFISNELKIGKYTLSGTADKYKSFILNVTGRVAVTDNGVNTTVSNVLTPTAVSQINTGNIRIYNYLNDIGRRNRTFSQAKALNFGSAHNGCVYFSSQALRNVGIGIPKSTALTNRFASKLQGIGWRKITNYRKLTPGSLCFTKDPWGGNGKPTHVYVFMGWVKKSDYTQAYICDNQAGEYNGQVLHVRNVSIKAKHNGQYKDAFNYAMVAPETYNYIK